MAACRGVAERESRTLKVTYTLDSPVKSRETRYRTLRYLPYLLGTYLVVYRSNYGLYSMLQRPAPLLRSHPPRFETACVSERTERGSWCCRANARCLRPLDVYAAPSWARCRGTRRPRDYPPHVPLRALGSWYPPHLSTPHSCSPVPVAPVACIWPMRLGFSSVVDVVVEFVAVPREEVLVGPVRERHGHRERVRPAPTPYRPLAGFELGVVGVLVAVERSVQAERGLVAPA